MFKTAKPLFFAVETPLHAGSGNDLGVVDLPIQREKHTGYPKIEASGVKGSLREVFRSQPQWRQLNLSWNFDADPNAYTKALALAFGSDDGELHAGALSFTDARLLLFPVKSVSGVFAWVTCPFVIDRLKHDLSLCDIDFPCQVAQGAAVPPDAKLMVSKHQIVLEEYTFSVTPDPAVGQLAEWLAHHILPDDEVYTYWREKMKTDLVVLPDDDFRDFVTWSTEVIARIKIDPSTGIVQEGALWYEEYLPVDSVVYSLVLASPVFQRQEAGKGVFALNPQEHSERRDESEKVLEFFEDGLPAVMQIGGNATIGKGIVRTHLYQAEGA